MLPEIGDVWSIERLDLLVKRGDTEFPTQNEIVTIIEEHRLEPSQYGAEVILYTVINGKGIREKIPEWTFRKDGFRICKSR